MKKIRIKSGVLKKDGSREVVHEATCKPDYTGSCMYECKKVIKEEYKPDENLIFYYITEEWVDD